MATIHEVYYGSAEALIAEVGALDCRDWDHNGFYVQPIGGDKTWDTETFAALEDAKAEALYLAETYQASASYIA